MDDSCRMDFMKLIGRLEDENEDNNEAIEQMPVYDHSTIYFNLDSARISHNDDMVIKDMAKKMMSDKDFKVVVKGYADLNGTEEYNDMISRKRAHHVAHYLKKHGVPCDKIVIHHFGSKHLAVAQAAGKVEPMNRRAEIELVK
jgi:outer membrane protein OmpA-like peptidoglycan-associated protein